MVEVMRGLLSAGDQQGCLLSYLPFDESTEQVQQPLPIGAR
jgi:hypothetical protein